MTNTQTRQIARAADPIDQVPETGGSGDVLQLAEAWAKVAREAHEDCVKGEAAESDLQRRRNRSGQ